MPRKLVAAVLATLCAVCLFAPAALAAPNSGPHKGPNKVTPNAATYTYCNSKSTCDNKDAFDTGCANDAAQQGATITGEDTTHLQIYWSPTCSANYAYVQSPDGYPLKFVTLERSDQFNTNCNVTSCTFSNSNNSILTCNTQISGCNTYFGYVDPNAIPSNGTTWQTNMFYAPNQQVRVVVTTYLGSGGTNYISGWH